MSAQCGKGWTNRCAAAQSKKCQCSCGGANHGKARPIEQHPAVAPNDVKEFLSVLDSAPSWRVRPFDFTDNLGRRAQTSLAICGKVVIATELNDNPGASITNAAEQLWAQVREELGDEIIAIEHYPNSRGFPEDWDLVTIVDGEAQWSSLSRATVAKLIADPASLEVKEGVATLAVA